MPKSRKRVKRCVQCGEVLPRAPWHPDNPNLALYEVCSTECAAAVDVREALDEHHPDATAATAAEAAEAVNKAVNKALAGTGVATATLDDGTIQFLANLPDAKG